MTYGNKVFTNVITHRLIEQATPLDKEVEVYDKSILLSESDKNGIITYTNRRYLKLTGFSEEELIGAPHKLLRHPDMPQGVYKAMSKITHDKKIWRGYVKHLCKDGSYLWTLTYLQAKLDAEGNIIGYISTGKMAYDETRTEVEEKYKSLMGEEHIDDPFFMKSESYKEFLSEYTPTPESSAQDTAS